MPSIVAMAGQALVLIASPDPAMYSERPQAGALLSTHGSMILCGKDARSAIADAEEIVKELADTGHASSNGCRSATSRPWRIVSILGSRCMAARDAEWCEAEAHAVIVERGGSRRYAVMTMTAAQTD